MEMVADYELNVVAALDAWWSCEGEHARVIIAALALRNGRPATRKV
jgi:hypothetical protein